VSAAVDANVLVYASDPGSPLQREALETLAQWAEGPDLLYVFWPVAMAYLRIVTHSGIFSDPLPPADAIANVEELISRPNVRTPGEGDGFWKAYTAVADDQPVRGNLVPDAHLVALMRQHGVGRIITRDRGFRRFRGIDVLDPFG